MSSPPPQSQTILLPFNLGPASGFDRTLFPLSSYKKRDSLGRSDYYPDATLDEMVKITNIGANPEQLRKFVKTTRATYDQLILWKAELELRLKIWNIANQSPEVELLDALSKSVSCATKSRSDETVRAIGRELLVSAPGEKDVQPAEDDPSLNMDIAGIAVRLDRPLDDTTSQQLINAANTIFYHSGTFKGDEAASYQKFAISPAIPSNDLYLAEVSSALDEYYLASERRVLGRNDYYLDATLDEMLKITSIANPEHWQRVFCHEGQIRSANPVQSGA